jgi:hypothetical protein
MAREKNEFFHCDVGLASDVTSGRPLLEDAERRRISRAKAPAALTQSW